MQFQVAEHCYTDFFKTLNMEVQIHAQRQYFWNPSNLGGLCFWMWHRWKNSCLSNGFSDGETQDQDAQLELPFHLKKSNVLLDYLHFFSVTLWQRQIFWGEKGWQTSPHSHEPSDFPGCHSAQQYGSTVKTLRTAPSIICLSVVLQVQATSLSHHGS